MCSDDFSTTYTIIILITIATIMFSKANFARSDSTVVSAPAPATIGKASGTIEAVSGVVAL